MLTQEKVRELLTYNRITGKLTWRLRPDDCRANRIFNARFADKVAGVTCPRGYQYVRIREFGFFAIARLIWLYETGAWPLLEMDHINGNPSDNRLVNIRLATRSENGANRGTHKNNKSGYKGVVKQGNRWEATVRMNNKRYRLGSFETPEAAHVAYRKKAEEVQREFARP